MGMSASQARLLMLTARKSDLEYQAQQITQQKLALAQQEEAIATSYNDAISNTEYTVFNFSKQSGAKEEVPMTLANIHNAGYVLLDGNGKEVKVGDYQAVDNDAGGSESYIKFMMENHGWRLELKPHDNQDEQTVSMSADFRENYDTSDDAVAEAEYNSEIKKIHTKEKKLDLTLKQIETQHEAVKQEMESVEKIVKDNVEKTFKTFA